MKNLGLLLFTIITIAIISCKDTRQPANQDINNSQINNDDDLIGSYGFKSNGQAQFSIIKDGNAYYLKISNRKEKMSKILDADCLRILGSNWQSKFISGLHSGAFFIFKVREGSLIQGISIHSGYFGALPAAGEIWKIK